MEPETGLRESCKNFGEPGPRDGSTDSTSVAGAAARARARHSDLQSWKGSLMSNQVRTRKRTSALRMKQPMSRLLASKSDLLSSYMSYFQPPMVRPFSDHLSLPNGNSRGRHDKIQY